MTTTCCGGEACGPAVVTNVFNGQSYTGVLPAALAQDDQPGMAEKLAELAAFEDEARELLDTEPLGAEGAIAAFLDALGIVPDEHTAETPKRVAKAFRELLRGYGEDPRVHLHRQFPGPSDAGVVVVSGVRFTSLCAHHLLPFSGKATVAYLPGAGEPIVGLSKLARVLEGYAARLQTQEVLGAQVVDALEETLAPLGAACLITSHHNCMGIRGVKQADAVMTTSSLRGVFRDDPAARAELLALHQA